MAKQTLQNGIRPLLRLDCPDTPATPERPFIHGNRLILRSDGEILRQYRDSSGNLRPATRFRRLKPESCVDEPTMKAAFCRIAEKLGTRAVSVH